MTVWNNVSIINTFFNHSHSASDPSVDNRGAAQCNKPHLLKLQHTSSHEFHFERALLQPLLAFTSLPSQAAQILFSRPARHQPTPFATLRSPLRHDHTIFNSRPPRVRPFGPPQAARSWRGEENNEKTSKQRKLVSSIICRCLRSVLRSLPVPAVRPALEDDVALYCLLLNAVLVLLRLLLLFVVIKSTKSRRSHPDTMRRSRAQPSYARGGPWIARVLCGSSFGRNLRTGARSHRVSDLILERFLHRANQHRARDRMEPRASTKTTTTRRTCPAG